MQKSSKKRQTIDKKTHPKKKPQKIDFGRGFDLPKPSQNRSKSDKKRYKKTIQKKTSRAPADHTGN